jgi:hypothetical protein
MDRELSELAILTRMFSASVVRELGKSGKSGLLARLFSRSRTLSRVPGDESVGQALDSAFRELRTLGNRDEYVYRSAITEKILLGRHSLRTAAVLSETRVGASKVDMVVLNGTSTAYEIKSERDSLSRLSGQLDSYRRVFATVNVVTSPSHAGDVLRLAPTDVGVLVLSSRFTLQTERLAITQPSRIRPESVLDMVRASEAVMILRALGMEVPSVPNTQLRGVLHPIYASLDPTRVHERMVTTLKKTRSQSASDTLVKELPGSLRAAMLALKMDEKSQHRVRDAVNVPLRVAFTWS